MRRSASGFCVYNDPAIAIKWMLEAGAERIAYVDVDVHHGDGVQAAFYDDPRVLTISLHEHPATLFPGTGLASEIGSGEGRGYAVNVALPAFTGDAGWLRAFDAVVPPLLRAFGPEVLVSQHGLDVVRLKVSAGTEPWKSAYAQVRDSSYASLSWRPQPRSSVDCGSNSNPDRGCTDEHMDGVAAYTQALIWYLTGDRRSAAKAIQILNAWPPVLKKHTNSNAKLQAGWAGATFARAAELVRYSGAGWSAAAATRFGTMLRTD